MFCTKSQNRVFWPIWAKILPCHFLEGLRSQIVSHILRMWRLIMKLVRRLKVKIAVLPGKQQSGLFACYFSSPWEKKVSMHSNPIKWFTFCGLEKWNQVNPLAWWACCTWTIVWQIQMGFQWCKYHTQRTTESWVLGEVHAPACYNRI